MIISTIFILVSFILILVIATQVKDLKDKEDNQNKQTDGNIFILSEILIVLK